MENQHLEFEELRQQMDMLKQKLEKQEIVNEQLLRQSMSNRVSWIHKYVIGEIIALPFVFLLMIAFAAADNISWWCCAFILVLSVVDVFLDYKYNAHKAKQLMDGDLLQTAEQFVATRKKVLVQNTITGTLGFIWLAWFGYEFTQSSVFVHTPVSYAAWLAIFGFSTILAFVVCVWLIHRILGSYDSVIKDINQLEG